MTNLDQMKAAFDAAYYAHVPIISRADHDEAVKAGLQAAINNTTEATRLKRLHDNLRFTLEDWDGHFHHEKEFERLFDAAIEEAEGL